MKIGSNEKRKELVEAALGSRLLDLVIQDVKLVNVFTGEIYRAEIGIYGKFIAHISADPDRPTQKPESLDAKNTFNGKGMYVLPGFIDPHIHIESTMMTPSNFTASVLPSGTTTVVTDPHEVANVLGIQAVKYMYEASENLPMRQYILAPSCVPASPGLENAGATLEAEEVAQILEWNRVIGLGEIMDFAGVISNDKRIRSIIHEAEERNGFLQGHAPRLTGRKLSEQHKRKISKSGIGIKFSEEHKRKIGEANKGKKSSCYGKFGLDHPASKSVKMFYLDTNEFIQEFETGFEAQAKTGINNGNISLCCSGKRMWAGKYRGKKVRWQKSQKVG